MKKITKATKDKLRNKIISERKKYQKNTIMSTNNDCEKLYSLHYDITLREQVWEVLLSQLEDYDEGYDNYYIINEILGKYLLTKNNIVENIIRCFYDKDIMSEMDWVLETIAYLKDTLENNQDT